jgi:hypothetical protein
MSGLSGRYDSTSDEDFSWLSTISIVMRLSSVLKTEISEFLKTFFVPCMMSVRKPRVHNLLGGNHSYTTNINNPKTYCRSTLTNRDCCDSSQRLQISQAQDPPLLVTKQA